MRLCRNENDNLGEEECLNCKCDLDIARPLEEKIMEEIKNIIKEYKVSLEFIESYYDNKLHNYVNLDKELKTKLDTLVEEINKFKETGYCDFEYIWEYDYE